MMLTAWRHPKPRDVAGLCLGRTDAPVDARKAKRLAHRIRRWARRERAPRVVITSPLQRAAAVGRWLARWGWVHRVDERLSELDFGRWDGRPWADIGAADVQAWCDDFMRHAPGGGEPVAALLQRCAAVLAQPADVGAGAGAGAGAVCVVGHAGWLSAASWLQQAGSADATAQTWPPALRYGERVSFDRGRGGAGRPVALAS